MQVIRVFIFAEKGTKNRMAIQLPSREFVGEVQKELGKTNGGSWLWVQNLQPGEMIPFQAAEEYHGYDGRKVDDYCGNLQKHQR